jgi:hypothetical protein
MSPPTATPLAAALDELGRSKFVDPDKHVILRRIVHRAAELALEAAIVAIEDTDIVEVGGAWNRCDDGRGTLNAAERAVRALLPAAGEPGSGDITGGSLE